MADGEYGYYAQQTTRTRSFIGDADGTLLRKTDNGNVQNLYYAGDKSIGSVAGSAASPVADFDFNYAPVSDTYPAVSPGNYTVAAGDTLRGIAYKAWGDGKLWYLIADANGLMTDGDMHVGQALKIPNRISNLHNDYQTNKVYNAAEIIGDITPTLPDPPPPPQSSSGGDGGCGGFGSVLIMVVAIVATALTAGAAAIASQGVLSIGEVFASGLYSLGTIASQATLASAGATAVAGAVGNLAGQVVGNLAGIQDGIHFGQIASAGLSAGLGQALGSALLGESGLSGIGIKDANLQSAITFGTRNILNQGINLLSEQQQAFDWRQVATAAISAPIANLALSGVQGADVGSRLAQSVIRDVVNQGVSSMFYAGGRVNFAAIGANAFGMGFGSAEAFRSADYASQQESKLNAPTVDPGVDGVWSGAVASPSAPNNQPAAEASTESTGYLRLMGGLLDSGDRLDVSANRSVASDAPPIGGPRILDGQQRLALREHLRLATEAWNDSARTLEEKSNLLLDTAKNFWVDRAAESPTLPNKVLAYLASQLNSVAGEDGVLNPVSYATLGATATVNVLTGVAGATDALAALEKLTGLPESSRTVRNPLVRGVLSEAMEAALKAEQSAEGVVLKLFGKLGKLGAALKDFGTGTGAELAVKGVFVASQLFSEVTVGIRGITDKSFFASDVVARPDLRNSSDNGIDILAKERFGDKAGKWVGFEVKASVNGQAPSLRGEQRDEANVFIRNRLIAMRGGGPPFEGNRLSPGVRDFAKSVLAEQGRTSFDGYVFKITNYGKANVNVTSQPWVQRK